MKIEGELRGRILAQLASPESRRIIATTRRESKTALAICKELSLPTSSAYRRIAELKDCGLLMVDRVLDREDGKKEAAYICAFAHINVRVRDDETELDLVPTERAIGKRWFDLFSKPPPDSPGAP